VAGPKASRDNRPQLGETRKKKKGHGECSRALTISTTEGGEIKVTPTGRTLRYQGRGSENPAATVNPILVTDECALRLGSPYLESERGAK